MYSFFLFICTNKLIHYERSKRIKIPKDHEWLSLDGDVATVGVTDLHKANWVILFM